MGRLRSASTPGAFAIDDVGAGEGPTKVPEPGTQALARITALGVCAVGLRRHRTRSALRRR